MAPLRARKYLHRGRIVRELLQHRLARSLVGVDRHVRVHIDQPRQIPVYFERSMVSAPAGIADASLVTL